MDNSRTLKKMTQSPEPNILMRKRSHQAMGMTDKEPMGELVLHQAGDVVLTLGSPPNLRLLVSSDFLSAVSPVFEVMLDGSFSEGHAARTVQRPQGISLPEDDARAMTDLCYLIHHQPQHVTATELKAERLYRLLVAADKYDCLKALELSTRGLMRMRPMPVSKDQMVLQDLAFDTASAYLLKHTIRFESMTRLLMIGGTWKMSQVADEEGAQHLPMSAILWMAEQREAVFDMIAAHGLHYCENETGSSDIKGFSIQGQAVFEILNILKHTTRILPGKKCFHHLYRASLSASEKRRKLDLIVTELEQASIGLCLGCIIEGDMENPTLGCSKHQYQPFD